MKKAAPVPRYAQPRLSTVDPNNETPRRGSIRRPSATRTQLEAPETNNVNASKGNSPRHSVAYLKYAVSPLNSSTSKTRQVDDNDVLQRKLSFIDVTIGDIKLGVESEDPEWEFKAQFWGTVLLQKPSQDFTVLEHQTLPFWIDVYNNWQDMQRKRLDAGKEKIKYLDGDSVNELFSGIHRGQLLKAMRLFHPAGFQKIVSEGASTANLLKLRINALQVMVAGVLMSKNIKSGYKLRFIFGLVDESDSRCLKEEEFFEFIRLFIGALGCVFDISESDIMPTDKHMRRIANKLYSRISALSGKRLRALAAKGGADSKAAIAAAIRQRQQEGQKPQYKRSMTMQTLKYKTIEKWCFRGLKDPLGVPFALAIERFCFLAKHGGGEYEKITWNLSHDEVVETPVGSGIHHELVLPTRGEVLLCRSTFDYAMTIGFGKINLTDLELYMKKQQGDPKFEFEQDLWEKLSSGLGSASSHGCHDFAGFLRFVYRKLAEVDDDYYIQMLLQWVKEYDATEDKRKKVSKAMEAACVDSHKELIPEEELVEICNNFSEICDTDYKGEEYVTPNALSDFWDFDIHALREHLNTYGIYGERVSKEDFIRLACPDSYRLPDLGGVDRLLFGALVKYKSGRLEKKLEKHEATSGDRRRSMPQALWKEVSEPLWKEWQDAFSRLDRTGDDKIEVSELRNAGLEPDICDFLVSFLCKGCTDEKEASFNREKFLSAMLKAHQFKRKDFNALSLKSKKKQQQSAKESS